MSEEKNTDLSSDIDAFLNDINSDAKEQPNTSLQPIASNPPAKSLKKNKDLKRFVIDSASDLVQNNVNLIQKLQLNVIASKRAEDVEALAALIQTTTKSLDILNKIVLQNDKIKADQNKNVANVTNIQNNTTIVTTREKIMEMLKEDDDVIDLPPDDTNHQS